MEQSNIVRLNTGVANGLDEFFVLFRKVDGNLTFKIFGAVVRGDAREEVARALELAALRLRTTV